MRYNRKEDCFNRQQTFYTYVIQVKERKSVFSYREVALWTRDCAKSQSTLHSPYHFARSPKRERYSDAFCRERSRLQWKQFKEISRESRDGDVTREQAKVFPFASASARNFFLNPMSFHFKSLQILFLSSRAPSIGAGKFFTYPEDYEDCML